MTLNSLTGEERKSLFESRTAVPTKKKGGFGLFSGSDGVKKFKRKAQAIRKLFGVEDDLVIDVSASRSFSTRITIPGRLFLMQHHILFYSDVFDIEQKLIIHICDVVNITKTQDDNINVETKEGKTWTFNAYGRSKDSIFTKMMSVYNSAVCPIGKGGVHHEDIASDVSEGEADDEEDDAGFEWISRAAKEEGFLNTDSEGERVELVSAELPVSVKNFYKLFLQDEVFYKHYHEQRSDTDIEISPWISQEELGNVRQLKFRVKVKGAPFGPPTSLVDETQRYYNQASDPNHLVVETLTSVKEVQYGDSFRVEVRLDITAVPGELNKVKIVITIGVSFLKRIRIPGISGTIRSRSIEDNRQSAILFVNLAKEELQKTPLGHPIGTGSSGSKKSLLAHGTGSTGSSPASPVHPSPRQSDPVIPATSSTPSASSSYSTGSSSHSTDSSSSFGSASLLIIVAIVVLLAVFWQLNSLKTEVHEIRTLLAQAAAVAGRPCGAPTE